MSALEFDFEALKAVYVAPETVTIPIPVGGGVMELEMRTIQTYSDRQSMPHRAMEWMAGMRDTLAADMEISNTDLMYAYILSKYSVTPISDKDAIEWVTRMGVLAAEVIEQWEKACKFSAYITAHGEVEKKDANSETTDGGE